MLFDPPSSSGSLLLLWILCSISGVNPKPSDSRWGKDYCGLSQNRFRWINKTLSLFFRKWQRGGRGGIFGSHPLHEVFNYLPVFCVSGVHVDSLIPIAAPLCHALEEGLLLIKPQSPMTKVLLEMEEMPLSDYSDIWSGAQHLTDETLWVDVNDPLALVWRRTEQLSLVCWLLFKPPPTSPQQTLHIITLLFIDACHVQNWLRWFLHYSSDYKNVSFALRCRVVKGSRKIYLVFLIAWHPTS